MSSRQVDRAAKRRLAREELRVRKIIESELTDMDPFKQKELIDRLVQRNTTAPIQYESEGMAVEVRRWAEHIANELHASGFDTVVLSNTKEVGTLLPIKAKIAENGDSEAVDAAIAGASEVYSDGIVTAHEYRQNWMLRYVGSRQSGELSIADIIAIRNQLAEDHDIILQISAECTDSTVAIINLFPHQDPTCGHGRQGTCPHCIGS